MSYQPGVYRAQGGNELVVASTTSGGTQGKITVQGQSAGIQFPVQTLTSTQTGTNITPHGLTTLVATTTAPTYTIAAPIAAGLLKLIAITSATSAASSVKVAAASTGIRVGVTGDNQVTITSTGVGAGVVLCSASTAIWAICSPGLSSQVSSAQTT